MNQMDKTGAEAAVLPAAASFTELLDETCTRLWDRRVRYSVRRIRDLEETLATLELELDLMIRE
ncbi:hypothetical protein FACS1894137_16450 [Spirochaetia bacterium]|nr:hypothetical protein FACS1894137_16450 [Spirochaetia bacterium]